MSRRWSVVLVSVLLCSQIQSASGAGVTLSTYHYGQFWCPGVQWVLVSACNTASTPQTIPAGTTFTLTFTAPVHRTPGDTAVIVWPGFSGNQATLAFPADFQLAGGFSCLDLYVELDLSGLPSQTPIAVTMAATPADAIQFTRLGPSFTIGFVDSRRCQPSPGPAITGQDLIANCPTKPELDALNQALQISFEGDPTAGTLVCQAANGSADLTLLQERTYEALRMMKAIPFEIPLPWTSRNLYDWFINAIHGIRMRKDLNFSYCCDPAGVINIKTGNLGAVQYSTSFWLGTLMVGFVHEARHNEGRPHTCGTNDQTLSELGAWGVQYYVNEWMALYGGLFLAAKDDADGQSPFLELTFTEAWSMTDTNICDPEGGLVSIPRNVDFGAPKAGGVSAPRTVAVTSTRGLPETMGAVTIAGANAADFTVVENHCTGRQVPPSCAVVMQFRPGGAGTRTAQLQIAHGSKTETVALSGSSSSTCTFALWPFNAVFSGAGGAGVASVYSAPDCRWTATSNAPWLASEAASGGGALHYTVTPNTDSTARQATLTVAGQTFTVTQGPAASVPTFAQGGVRNAANDEGILTPGSIAILTGAGLLDPGVEAVAAGHMPLPTQLSGTSVTLNGTAAPLYAVARVNGEERIWLQVPYEIAGSSQAKVSVLNNGNRSADVSVLAASLSPGVFTVDGINGLVLDATTGRVVTTAARGQRLRLFATGLGSATHDPRTGDPAPTAAPLATPLAAIAVSIGGVTVTEASAELAPAWVGLYQLTVKVPDGVQSGTVPLVLQAGGAQSRPVLIDVQ